MQPQNKGPEMLWGQSYVLPMTWGVEAYGGPLSVDMQPYGCFIHSCNHPTKISQLSTVFTALTRCLAKSEFVTVWQMYFKIVLKLKQVLIAMI